MFAYPLLRTILMSLHSMPGISSRMSDWTFAVSYTHLTLPTIA